MADSGYKNISRMDVPAKKMHGWYVRIRHKGESYAKFFNDNKSGGYEHSLQDAIEHRNQLEQQLSIPRTERYIISATHPKNNTGVPGVIRKMSKQKKRGKWYEWEVYEVTWNPEPGRVMRTTVSIQKYGEEEAFRRACAIREEKIAAIYQATREPEEENPHIRWIEYQGQRILSVDFRNLLPDAAARVVNQTNRMVKNWPAKVRLLYNIEGSEAMTEVLEQINQMDKAVLANTEKIAVVGASGLRVQLLKAYSLFTRNSFTLFSNETDALNWLAE